LPQETLYAKERRLIEEIKNELAEGRRCQVYAVYTQKRDVTARLEQILAREGIRTAVLRRNVPTDKREAWYAKKVKEGVQVVIAHPKLVETGPGPARLSNYSFLRIRLLITYPAAGCASLLENWPKTSRARQVHVLRKHDANFLPAPHG
jgi:hypothetical protein